MFVQFKTPFISKVFKGEEKERIYHPFLDKIYSIVLSNS